MRKVLAVAALALAITPAAFAGEAKALFRASGMRFRLNGGVPEEMRYYMALSDGRMDVLFRKPDYGKVSLSGSKCTVPVQLRGIAVPSAFGDSVTFRGPITPGRLEDGMKDDMVFLNFDDSEWSYRIDAGTLERVL